jgi:hypothetical protein
MSREQSVVKLLQEKAAQVSSAANLIVEKTRDWQMIKLYISNRVEEIKLTPTQAAKLLRYQYIYNQLVSGRYTEQEIINQVMRLYDVKIVQAYEDINNAREIWLTTLNINKRFELKMELESAKDCKRKCIEIGDFKNAASYSKIITGLLHEIQEEEESPADLFEGIQIEATFNPALLGAPPISKKDMQDLLKTINAKRAKPFNLDFIEELEYEDA